MEETLHQLGRILLYGLPTSFFVILLCLYLRAMFFKPFEAMLDARYQATEGAKKAAEESLAKAHAKAAEFDAALAQARQEIYSDQEQYLKKLHDQQAAELLATRTAAEQKLAQSRAALAADASAARESLRAQSDLLASHIAETVLVGKPA